LNLGNAGHRQMRHAEDPSLIIHVIDSI
jgi:hypothetical protein